MGKHQQAEASDKTTKRYKSDQENGYSDKLLDTCDKNSFLWKSNEQLASPSHLNERVSTWEPKTGRCYTWRIFDFDFHVSPGATTREVLQHVQILASRTVAESIRTCSQRLRLHASAANSLNRKSGAHNNNKTILNRTSSSCQPKGPILWVLSSQTPSADDGLTRAWEGPKYPRQMCMKRTRIPEGGPEKPARLSILQCRADPEVFSTNHKSISVAASLSVSLYWRRLQRRVGFGITCELQRRTRKRDGPPRAQGAVPTMATFCVNGNFWARRPDCLQSVGSWDEAPSQVVRSGFLPYAGCLSKRTDFRKRKCTLLGLSLRRLCVHYDEYDDVLSVGVFDCVGQCKEFHLAAEADELCDAVAVRSLPYVQQLLGVPTVLFRVRHSTSKIHWSYHKINQAWCLLLDVLGVLLDRLIGAFLCVWWQEMWFCVVSVKNSVWFLFPATIMTFLKFIECANECTYLIVKVCCLRMTTWNATNCRTVQVVVQCSPRGHLYWILNLFQRPISDVIHECFESRRAHLGVPHDISLWEIARSIRSCLCFFSRIQLFQPSFEF